MARDGKFMRMINYGKVYRPTEELAFALATVCDAGDIDLQVAKDVIDTIAKVQHAAHMYTSQATGEA